MAKTCTHALTFLELYNACTSSSQHLQSDGHYSERMFPIYRYKLCAKQGGKQGVKRGAKQGGKRGAKQGGNVE